ncbi:MAG TPA: hypothetical protein VLA56_17860 [Pseudomonadales bacterium]|nr:hypothetical protein [Pseudomonadales bacterium]
MKELSQTAGIVLLGVVAWGLVWNLANAAAFAIWPQGMEGTAYVDDPAPLLSLLAVSIPLSVAVGALAARLAGARARRTVYALAAVQLLIGIGVQAAYWTRMPIWFHLPFLLFIIPATVYGGFLVGFGEGRGATENDGDA